MMTPTPFSDDEDILHGAGVWKNRLDYSGGVFTTILEQIEYEPIQEHGHFPMGFLISPCSIYSRIMISVPPGYTRTFQGPLLLEPDRVRWCSGRIWEAPDLGGVQVEVGTGVPKLDGLDG